MTARSCDEGGECHLQDMTVMTGHHRREYRFEKRTHRNQYLGPFINHEMNRCIQCYRCVRFYPRLCRRPRFQCLLAVTTQVYFGRQQPGAPGKRVQRESGGDSAPRACLPTKPQKRHYTRKWDLQTAPSVCVHCGLGCNTHRLRALTGPCGASATATTNRSTDISCATADATAMNLSIPNSASGGRSVRTGRTLPARLLE